MQVVARPAVPAGEHQLALPGFGHDLVGQPGNGEPLDAGPAKPSPAPQSTASADQSTVRRVAAAPLSLPSVDRTIPTSITLSDRERLDRGIAGALVEAGWMRSHHLAQSRSIPDAIETAIVEGVVGGIDLDNYMLNLTVANTDVDVLDITSPEPGAHLSVTVSLDTAGSAVIGPRLMSMCRGDIRPAQEVLSIIEAAAECSMPLFTPGVAHFMLMMHHWQGMESYREAREELRAMGENPADLDLISETEAFGHMPRWTTQPRGITLPMLVDRPEHVRETALANWRDRLPADLLNACDRVIEAATKISTPGFEDPNTGCGLEDHEEGGPTYCALVRWDDRDQIPRLFDDWGEFAVQAGSVGIVTRRTMDTRSIDQTRFALDNLAEIFAVAAAIDDLLNLLNTET